MLSKKLKFILVGYLSYFLLNASIFLAMFLDERVEIKSLLSSKLMMKKALQAEKLLENDEIPELSSPDRESTKLFKENTEFKVKCISFY